jgi:hypothetical protein
MGVSINRSTTEETPMSSREAQRGYEQRYAGSANGKAIRKRIETEYRERNRERRAEHRRANTTEVREKWNVYRQRNLDMYAMQQAIRRAAINKAIPPWYESEKVSILYKRVKELNELLNLQDEAKLQVDHIIPLLSKTVCGLHCFANLQVLSKTMNQRKKNKYQADW